MPIQRAKSHGRKLSRQLCNMCTEVIDETDATGTCQSCTRDESRRSTRYKQMYVMHAPVPLTAIN